MSESRRQLVGKSRIGPFPSLELDMLYLAAITWMTKGEDEVGLTATDVKEELTNLLRVTVADPKWSQTRLLDLPIAERQFEASRQYGIRPAQANLNLAICLLQSVNQLTPASPAPRFFDTWKMLIGAELNCLGAIRGYVAGILPRSGALRRGG